MLLAEEMERTVRFWEWEAAEWENRVSKYSPENAEKFTVTTDIAEYPPLIAREQRERRLLFQGKAAYASRQASIRRSLQLTARQAFATQIPQLRGGPYREISEAENYVEDM